MRWVVAEGDAASAEAQERVVVCAGLRKLRPSCDFSQIVSFEAC